MISFEIVKDLAEAEKIWKALSPGESLFDDWDFRAGFHKYFQNEIFFIAGYENEELVGLLPLQISDNKTFLEFYAGSYMEDNKLFIKNGHQAQIPLFYKFAEGLSKPLKLEYIAGHDDFTSQLPLKDNKFVLPIDFSSGEEYIDKTFQGETKKKLKKRINKIADTGVSVAEGNSDDLEVLIEYNLKMFTDSAFRDRPHHSEIFRDFLLPNRNFKPKILTFVLNGQKHAITLALIYKDTYASINRGFHPEADKNLREFVQLKKVEDAIALGLKKFDGLAGDYGWKERWGLLPIPQYEYLKNPA